MIGERHGEGQYKIFDDILKSEVVTYQGNFSYENYSRHGRLYLEGITYECSLENNWPHGCGKLHLQ
jgi:hypothetical protein